MAIKPVLRQVGTGKPVRSDVAPNVNRNPSRKGVMQSGIASNGEFQNIQRTRTSLNQDMLGDKAVEVVYSLGKRVNVTV